MIARLRHWSQSFGRITINGRYRPEIDGLRFFAIAFVLAGHLMERSARALALRRPLTGAEQVLALLIPKATTGVLLFFTISGYILAIQFHRQAGAGQAFRYRPYLARRASRIVPPYFLVLLAGYLALAVAGYRPALMDRGQSGLPLTESFLVSLGFVHGALLGAMPRAFPPGWSLEVEVQFYVVAPVLFAAMMRSSRAGRRAWKWLVLGASVAMMALCTILLGQIGAYYLSLLRFLPYFMLGPLLVLAFADGTGAPIAPALADAIGALALVGLALTGIEQNFASGWLAVTALDCARMLAIAGMFVGAVRGRRFKALCSLRWISVLGGACFSLYLCHLQVMQVLTPVIARLFSTDSLAGNYVIACFIELPVVVGVSMAFYLAIERPFMKGVSWNLLSWRKGTGVVPARPGDAA